MRIVTIILSAMFLAATGTIPLLKAQTDATKAPLSFYGLSSGQEISFSVYTNQPQASFGVEVSTQPQPQAKIRLSINSSIQIIAAEKIWGHPAGEEVTRLLSPTDMQTLEKFLAVYRAKGALPPPALSGTPAMAFERITYRINQEGHRYADPDRIEFYPVSEEAQRDFIKTFIGFSEPSGKVKRT